MLQHVVHIYIYNQYTSMFTPTMFSRRRLTRGFCISHVFSTPSPPTKSFPTQSPRVKLFLESLLLLLIIIIIMIRVALQLILMSIIWVALQLIIINIIWAVGLRALAYAILHHIYLQALAYTIFHCLALHSVTA